MQLHKCLRRSWSLRRAGGRAAGVAATRGSRPTIRSSQSSPKNCLAISSGFPREPIKPGRLGARRIIWRRACRARGCTTGRKSRVLAISGERVASAIASRNTAMTVGCEVSRTRFVAKVVSVDLKVSGRVRGGRQVRSQSAFGSARLLMQADKHRMLAAETGMEITLRDFGARRDIERAGSGVTVLGECLECGAAGCARAFGRRGAWPERG